MIDYKLLLEKYMREVILAESVAFVPDRWTRQYCENDYTEKEHAYLLKLRENLYDEE